MNTTNIRYSRHLNLSAVGKEGQKKLKAAHISIIGLGGLGTPASLYLASSGIGNMSIFDFDDVDETNLPRQILFRDDDVGHAKAKVAADRLRRINPKINCEAINKKFKKNNIEKYLDQSNIVLDCTDNFSSRWAINEICAQKKISLISGAAIRFEGQLSVFRHDLGIGPCFRCLYEEADENLNDCSGQGILAPVAGTIGCMMATEAIKLILNIRSDLYGQLWTYDGISGQSRIIRIPVKDDCPICVKQ
ncbi:MAG: HesA/MoeB/ThiF family protein [Pseudomonadota bacterium]|nr:HesA/MoeB/ThiF family protein [Pseudomonadota bacterium]